MPSGRVPTQSASIALGRICPQRSRYVGLGRPRWTIDISNSSAVDLLRKLGVVAGVVESRLVVPLRSHRAGCPVSEEQRGLGKGLAGGADRGGSCVSW